MPKRSVVLLSVANDKHRKIMFKDVFLVALSRNSISIKDKKIQMEIGDTIYEVDLYQFSVIWQPSFEHIFKNDLPLLMQENALSPSTIGKFYEWSNPIFDEFPVEIKERNNFLNEFKNRVEKNVSYREKVRNVAIAKVQTLEVAKRKDYIDRFISFGILAEEDKVMLQYYAMYTPEKLKILFDEKQMSERERIEIVSQAFVQERDKKRKAESKGKRFSNNRIVNLVNLLGISEILDIFMSGILTDEEFSRTKVTKKDLLAAPYEILLVILSDKNDLLPDRLKITSRDLVNEYGRNLNGSKIFKFASYGYIEPEDLIEVYEINKALIHTNYDEDIFENEELLAFYTPTRLIDMKAGKKFSPRFLECYLELLDVENNPERFELKSQALVEELKRRNEKTEEEVLYFFDIGLCSTDVARKQISEEYIEQLFMSNMLPIEKVLEYYQKGLISDDAISKYYSPQEILELYENGRVNGKCLSIVRDTDLLTEEFVEGKIANEDFIRLYFIGNLSITDLEDAIQLSERQIDISIFIDENVPFLKIKELFSKGLIDYASILRLRNNGVITDEQLEEAKNALSTKKFFEELRKGKKYKVITSREEGVTSRTRRENFEEKREEDFSAELGLISELLETDVENEPYSLIESYNSKGRPTSLNNYRIFGNEKLDGIVILQKSKRENAVYVMSAFQLMYFLRGKENENGEIEVQNRMRDKFYLKTIEGVEVVEHTEYFARNLVEAVARVSPTISERVRSADGGYIEVVGKMVDDMRERYLDMNARNRDED